MNGAQSQVSLYNIMQYKKSKPMQLEMSNTTEFDSILDEGMIERIREAFAEKKMMVKVALKRWIGISQTDSLRVKIYSKDW